MMPVKVLLLSLCCCLPALASRFDCYDHKVGRLTYEEGGTELGFIPSHTDSTSILLQPPNWTGQRVVGEIVHACGSDVNGVLDSRNAVEVIVSRAPRSNKSPTVILEKTKFLDD